MKSQPPQPPDLFAATAPPRAATPATGTVIAGATRPEPDRPAAVVISNSYTGQAAAAGTPVEVVAVPAEPQPQPQPQVDASAEPVAEPAPEAAIPPPAEPAKSEAPPQRDASGRKLEPVPFYPRDTGEMFRYAGFLARSSLVPYALRGKADDILLVLLKGHDLGLKPQQAIATIHVIDGKAEVGALLMVSLILKSGLCESWHLVFSDTTRAVYQTKRRGDLEPTSFEYTIQEADQMGLLDKGRDERAKANNQWKKQPRTMLRRRAQANLAREVYPDVVMGLYDHDELTELRSDLVRLDLTPVQIAESIEVEARPPDPAPRALAAPVPSALATALETTPELVPVARREPRDPLKDRLAARAAAMAPPAVAVPDEVMCPRCKAPSDQPAGKQCTPCVRELQE